MVISQKGFHSASLSDLCDEMEISNGAFYKYFENKDAMGRAVFEHGVRTFRNFLSKQFDTIDDDIWSFSDSLLDSIIEFATEFPFYVHIMIDITPHYMGAYSEYHLMIEKNIVYGFRILFAFYQSKGVLPQSLNVNLLIPYVADHVMMFTFSLANEYHHKRFVNQYFPFEEKNADEVDAQEKKKLLLSSLKYISNFKD